MIGSENSQRIMLIRNGYEPRRPWYAYALIALSAVVTGAVAYHVGWVVFDIVGVG